VGKGGAEQKGGDAERSEAAMQNGNERGHVPKLRAERDSWLPGVDFHLQSDAVSVQNVGLDVASQLQYFAALGSAVID